MTVSAKKRELYNNTSQKLPSHRKLPNRPSRLNLVMPGKEVVCVSMYKGEKEEGVNRYTSTRRYVVQKENLGPRVIGVYYSY